jgi:hypothetical protein
MEDMVDEGDGLMRAALMLREADKNASKEADKVRENSDKIGASKEALADGERKESS